MIAIFTSRLFLALVGGSAVALALWLSLQLGLAHGTITGLNKDIVTTNEAWGLCKGDLAERESAVVGLHATLDARNADVVTWKAKAASAQADGDRRVALARKQAADYRRSAARHLAAVVTGGRCAWAAEHYVKTLTEERK